MKTKLKLFQAWLFRLFYAVALGIDSSFTQAAAAEDSAHCGVPIEESGSTGNRIQGDLIGTDATGIAAIGNISNGLQITGSTAFGFANKNLIGGADAEAGNTMQWPQPTIQSTTASINAQSLP